MAEGKKSFIAYSDWYGTFKALPDEIAGQLIKYIFSYVNDENPQPHENFVVNALFEQVKATLKRDLDKWEKQREQRSRAGKKSAEQRKSTSVNERSTSVNEKTRKATVNVNVNDNVNVNEIKDKSFTISHKKYFDICSSDLQYLDVFAMQTKTNHETAKKYLKDFCLHLVSINKQHPNIREFKSHFNNWRGKKTIRKLQPKSSDNLYQDLGMLNN